MGEAFTALEGRVGCRFAGRFRIEQVLGVGASAGVFGAFRDDEEPVAIKVLHARFTSDLVFKQRFLREARLASTIDHPGVIRVYETGITAEGEAFLVMEWLHGLTLEALRRNSGGSLDAERVRAVGRSVLDALSATHARAILHRDVKPSNLFLTDSGQVKVLDFGIARSLELSGQSTATGALIGTPAFMAPEQARGRHESLDVRTDVWAVGATLFMLLTGRAVHVATTPNEQLGLAMSAAAPKLRSVAPGVPKDLADVVDRALNFEPDQRWPSAQHMRAALEGRVSLADVDEAWPTTVHERDAAPSRRRARVPAKRTVFLTAAAGTLGVVVSVVAARGASIAGEPKNVEQLAPVDVPAAAARSDPAPTLRRIGNDAPATDRRRATDDGRSAMDVRSATDDGGGATERQSRVEVRSAPDDGRGAMASSGGERAGAAQRAQPNTQPSQVVADAIVAANPPARVSPASPDRTGGKRESPAPASRAARSGASTRVDSERAAEASHELEVLMRRRH